MQNRYQNYLKNIKSIIKVLVLNRSTVLTVKSRNGFQAPFSIFLMTKKTVEQKTFFWRMEIRKKIFPDFWIKKSLFLYKIKNDEDKKMKTAF